MKKYLLLILLSLFSLVVIAQTKPSAGDGSKEKPYKIGNAQELLWFAGVVNGTLTDVPKDTLSCAELTADIDLSSVCGEEIGSWNPIGFSGNSYSGTFDGKGYGIKNLYATGTSTLVGLGLFGNIKSATISDLSMLSGSIISSGSNIGSIAGTVYMSTIINCHNYIPISGGKFAGGVVGYASKSSIVKCHNEVNIKSYSNNGCGGICGCNYGSEVSYCYNVADIVCEAGRVGGIVGSLEFYGIIHHCFSIGSVTGSAQGGIYGYAETGMSSESKDNYFNSTTGRESTFSRFKKMDAFANGEVCYLLNAGSEVPVFFQSIGVDKYPVLNGNEVVVKDEDKYYNVSLSICEHGDSTYVDPTCTSCGLLYCTKCHKLFDTVPPISHDTTIVVTKPTCTALGYSTAKCDRCGLKLYDYDTVPVLGHDTTIDVTKPTCTALGYSTAKCDRCGLKLYNCDTVPALGHDTTIVETKPTCTKIGYSTAQCSVCGSKHYYCDTVPTIGHDTTIVETKPTCTKVGYSTAKCSMCGLKHYNFDTVPAISHDTTIVETKPTCTKVGYSTAKCSMCGLKYYNCDTVPALGHDTIFKHYEKTCHTEARTDTMCGRCGFFKMGVAEETPTMKHNYVNDICTVCGLSRSEEPELKDGWFLISNARELLWFSEYVYAGNTKVNAKLTADIDLSEVCGEKMKKNWLPIGEIDNKSWTFAGEFDGQGHTVSNLYFNNNLIKKDSAYYGHSEYDGDDIGLFGGNSGTIKNVKLKGLSITSVRYVGGIAANNNGTITDCSIESSNLKTVNTYIGGIVGYNAGKVSKCVSYASLTGTGYTPNVGGIVGYNDNNGRVSKCVSYASLVGSGEYPYIGGIAGYTEDTISHCISFASISVANISSTSYLGGIHGDTPHLVHGILYLSYNCFYVPKTNQNYEVSGNGFDNSSYYTADKKISGVFYATYIPRQEVFAGKACYLLNSDKNLKEPVWAQTLGVDKYPHLRSDDPNEKYVYKYYERNCYDSEEVEKFANCSFDSIPVDFAHLVTYPNHINEDDDPEKYDCCGLYTEEYLSQYSDKDFEIKSVEDLLKFRDIVAHGGRKVNANLMADIDLSGVCSSSIGSWTSISTYDGVFKGNGHSIENLYINKSEQASLFSQLNGEIRDLRVTGSVKSVNSAGICPSCHGTISGCISEVNVSPYSSYDKAGGLCFYVDGTIKNCLNLGKVTTNGIAYESVGEINDCIEIGSPKTTIYIGVNKYVEKAARYNITARDGDLYVLEDDTLSPEMMCLKLNSYEIGWGLAEINGVKTAVPAAFASKLIYPSGLATCPFNRTYSEYSDTMVAHAEYRFPEHIDADNDGVYDCCGYHPAFLKTYNDGVYEIRTAEQLKAFADEVNAGRFINASVRLMCDIDLSKVCGEKIGNWTPIYHFNGKFDGQFHKISGLYINQNGNSSDEWDVDMHDALGLFSGNYGEICRVGIANDCILKTDSLCIGAVCGVNYGSIHQCYNEADVVSTYGQAGGIVGYNGNDYWDYVGRLVNNYNIGSITGLYASGIAGITYCSVISNCYNYNTISDTIDKWEHNGISREIECGYQYMTNSFVLSDISRDTFFNSLDYSKVALITAAASQFASGEVCYALNKGQDSTVWYQTLNVDPYPVLDPTHGKVLYDEEKGVYYNYPDIIYTAVDQKENAKEPVSLVAFAVNRQVIVVGVDSFRIVDMLGHDVTVQNGSLADGVYIVVSDNRVAKVIIK
ncbi:MAG: hypothetical protein J6Y11_10885 [Paludibacteraceae bacterium]|nr:hypothetical protein [Paludibacteraceae bacterium]